jgi:tetratricopeptide (TPR) repeat protein
MAPLRRRHRGQRTKVDEPRRAGSSVTDPLITPTSIRIVPAFVSAPVPTPTMTCTCDRACAPTRVRPGRALLLGLALVASIVAGAGCEGINARRAVRQGNDEFKQGRYEQAIESFQQALKLEPGLPVANHNLGLAYFKLSGGTADPEKIREYSDKAAEYLGEYLKTDPKNSIIRNKMTQIWVDSDNFEKALAYWEAQLATEPTNQEMMAVLSGINFKAGRWEKSLEWLKKSIDVSPNVENKRSLYVQIGRRCRQVITNRDKIVGAERMKVSDVCMQSILTGLEGDPKNTELRGMVNVIMGIRALVHGASFANFIDKATGQDHDQLRRVYVQEAKALQAAQNPTPETNPTPSAGSGSNAGVWQRCWLVVVPVRGVSRRVRQRCGLGERAGAQRRQRRGHGELHRQRGRQRGFVVVRCLVMDRASNPRGGC